MLVKQRIVYNNNPDRQENGLWLKSWSSTTPLIYEQYRSRAYNVWMCINNRKNGSTNGFTDFQNFANWCQTEYGYNNVDTHGKFWSIEKDMILLGNRVYKEDTCMFVPAEVNSILNTHRGGNDLPLGVHHEHETKIRKWKYIGSCKGAQPIAARFNCQYEAHEWWLRQKINICEKFIDKHTEHKKLRNALINIRGIYLHHLVNHRVLSADVNTWPKI